MRSCHLITVSGQGKYVAGFHERSIGCGAIITPDRVRRISPDLLDLPHQAASQRGRSSLPVVSRLSLAGDPTRCWTAMTDGVAAHSLTSGPAVDIRVPIARSSRCASALGLGCGGVLVYPRSDFVHVEVGRIRHL